MAGTQNEIKAIHLQNDEIHDVHHMRYSYIELEENKRLEENFFELEKIRDEKGIVLAFKRGSEMIGTVRLVPMMHGITLTEKILKDYNNKNDGWEIGRLVLDKDNRGQKILVKCLCLTAKWLIDNSDVQYIFASCSHVMSRIYRRFGFKVIGNDLSMENSSKKYNGIFGHLPEVLKILEDLDNRSNVSS